MTTIITKAVAKNGKVLNKNNTEADDITHLTGGKGESTGFIIIQKASSIYIPNDLADKEATIEQLIKLNQELIEVCTTLVSVITPIGTAMITPVPGQAGLPSGLIPGFSGHMEFQSNINNIKEKLEAINKDSNKLKEELK